MDISEDMEGMPKTDEHGRLPLYTSKQLQAVEAFVKDVTDDTGVMFFFGDCTRESEAATKPYLLMNTVLGLMSVQHKGSMVLRLSSTLDKFSVDIIFLLYSLFDSALPFRPFAKSASSDTTYVVFRGMKDRIRTLDVCQRLLKIYDKVLQNPNKDIGDLLVWQMIERDDTLLQTIINLNNENLSVRADILKIALANYLKL